MIINSSDFQNNVGKYLELAEGQEIVITRNGTPVVRLLGMNKAMSFLSDRLVGLIPSGIDEDAEKAERVTRQ
jgi:prevent-host-death family protein